ncbi:MAG: slipin family protein [Nitrososphaerota archaeon]|nr:slipin family protein [Candidatus Calditenuaceae archaeon]MDW8073696.1 slipin family protein [Nitrososphaerota archaeon]
MVLTLQVGFGTIIGIVLLTLILIIILASAIRVVREYERAVIFRLGRVIGAKGPGLVLLVPIIDVPRIIDLRILTFDVPRQRIVTRDNVTVEVDAVVYMRVEDPMAAVLRVRDFQIATSLLAQTTLRDVIGQVELDDLLARRDELNKRIQIILDEATEPWGIKVTNVSIRDVVIPESMQRAMAKQAEAERERRSRVIMAEGELLAAQKMADAAAAYATNPYAMRLRELQTWAEIAREKNLIIVTEGGGSLGSLIGVTRGVSEQSGRK